MKIDAVGVSSSNLEKTVAFYTALGFKFPEMNGDEQHIEALTPKGGARLMIDSKELVTTLIGEAPKHGNHSTFAVLCSSSKEVDTIVRNIKSQGFTVVKEPWDAFWGQRYAVVADPDGYMVDVFANL